MFENMRNTGGIADRSPESDIEYFVFVAVGNQRYFGTCFTVSYKCQFGI